MKDKIKTLRIKAKLTQIELGKLLGFKTNVTVSMWERGERTPKADKLPELAKILCCEICDLFEEPEKAV